MTMPLPPKPKGELTQSEYGFILESTLKDVHLKEPSVISFIESL